MTYDEMLDSIERIYANLCNNTIHERSFSVHDLEELKYSNRELHQTLFFQEYLRLRTLATIEAYHEYLRDRLLDVARIDIGDLGE